MNLFEHPNHIGHCVIAGEAKCGSSSLYKYLCQHPNISCAKCKEINYLSKLGDKIPTQEAYSTLLNGMGSKNNPFMTIDGSAQYFRSPGGVPQKLHDMYPNSKIVLLFRNPVDRIYSNYLMNIKQNIEFLHNWPTFDKFLVTSGWRQHAINNYADNLERWYCIFPREQILAIKSEDLFERTQEILAEIFEFLGLSPYKIKDLTPIIPLADKQINTTYIRKLTSTGRHNHNASSANFRINVGVKELHQSSRGHVITGSVFDGHYPPMKQKDRILLAQHFKPMNKKLYTLVGKDFNWK